MYVIMPIFLPKRIAIGSIVVSTIFKRMNSSGFGSSMLSMNPNTKYNLMTEKSKIANWNFPNADFTRKYSTNQKPNEGYPDIMNFPVFIWPNLIKSFRNWVLANLIIARYFDTDFSLHDFIVGSKKAVDVVSHYIARGELKKLSGLVSPEAIAEVKSHLYNFSLRQQSELAIDQEDIFLCFPYEVGVMFDGEVDSKPQRRFVEITMCYHVLSGLKEFKDNPNPAPLNLSLIPEFQKRMFVVNYRFFRDFTEGVEAEWIINGFNHLKATSKS